MYEVLRTKSEQKIESDEDDVEEQGNVGGRAPQRWAHGRRLRQGQIAGDEWMPQSSCRVQEKKQTTAGKNKAGGGGGYLVQADEDVLQQWLLLLVRC